MINTSSELRDAMKQIVPGDARFRLAFETVSVSKSAVARYYLRVLEGIASGNTNPPRVISNNVRAVNLEHILPQSPSDDWSHIDSDTAKAFYNRLENLALMDTSRNKAVQNSGFKVKILDYEKTPFQLTQEIANEPLWGTDEIERRQKRLARLAVAAWPL